MLGNYGLDDEEALLDALTKQRLAAQKGIPAGTVGPADDVDPLEALKMPDLTPLPPRVDLTAARESDAQQRGQRGLEMAGRQLLSGLTLQKPPDAADLVTPFGDAEQNALADETRQRGDISEERRAQLAERQRVLAAMLRPQSKAPAMKPPTPVNPELEASKVNLNNAKAEKLRRPPVPKTPKPGAAGSPDGKLLPASEVSSLSELPVAEDQVDNLVGAFKRLNMGGMSGRASGAVTDIMGLRFTDAAEYNAAAKLAMQAAGKIMEGGKLAAGDEAKYAAMLPRPGDSDAVVQQKTAGLKTFLRDLAGRRAQAFKDSGYNVAPSLMPKAEQPTAPQDENAKALAWANANPNDPRSAAIKARLGVK